METCTYRPIGVIRSPHSVPAETPAQPRYAHGIHGRAEIFPAYAGGLADIEGFSHIYILFHFHRAGAAKLRVKPILEDRERGVFATRAPCRPNPLGMSLVRLVRREGNVLHLDDVDILDGTPILDIKPYIHRFDHRENVRSGWHEAIDEATVAERARRGYRPPAARGESKDSL